MKKKIIKDSQIPLQEARQIVEFAKNKRGMDLLFDSFSFIDSDKRKRLKSTIIKIANSIEFLDGGAYINTEKLNT